MNKNLKSRVINVLQGRKIISPETMGNSKSFCMKPWVHLFVSHFGTVTPCCITPWDKEQALGDINDQTVAEIWNGKPMRDLRLNMLKDKPDQRCWQCYENEKMGLHSDRHNTNFHFGHHLPWALSTELNGTAPESKPIHWDIRISNLCNFKCRICGHHSSSQWFEDAKALGLIWHEQKLNRGTKDFDRLMKQLDFVIPDLEEIYFAGGEPLIMEEHYHMLQMLIERGKTNIRLQYNTNFSQTHFKSYDLFEMWATFKNVHVLASLDGSGTRGELQRSGQRWQQVIDNRRRMMRVCPDVDFVIASTICIFNILHLPDFHRQCVEEGLITVDKFLPHTLKTPPEYNVRIMPQALKLEAEDKINCHINWLIKHAEKHPPVTKPLEAGMFEKIKDRMHLIQAERITGHLMLDIIINEFRNCITYMNASHDSQLLIRFRDITARLDRLRGENTRLVFPELALLWQETD